MCVWGGGVGGGGGCLRVSRVCVVCVRVTVFRAYDVTICCVCVCVCACACKGKR